MQIRGGEQMQVSALRFRPVKGRSRVPGCGTRLFSGVRGGKQGCTGETQTPGRASLAMPRRVALGSACWKRDVNGKSFSDSTIGDKRDKASLRAVAAPPGCSGQVSRR